MKKTYFGQRPYEAPDASLIIVVEEKSILSEVVGGIDDLEEDEFDWINN